MYSETDIEAAVAAGVMTREAADALRSNTAASRAAPAVDEESFRLVTGFNDIFVTIAAVLLLVAVGWIGVNIGGRLVQGTVESGASILGAFAFGSLFCGTAAWGLAEYFTRRRRMALPSILLLGVFVYAVGIGTYSAIGIVLGEGAFHNMAALTAVCALVAAIACWLLWSRFHVPITVAAVTGAVALTLLSLLGVVAPENEWIGLTGMLVAGIAMFAFAMWWDISDRERITRRSDVAFWLHLSAAPMIAHPLFWLLGVLGNDVGIGKAVLVLVLYALFGAVALAVDRRAMLVSSLIYVLYALSTLFRVAGAVSLNIALTALVIGSALLMLSAFWHNIRREVVRRLSPHLQALLPALDRPAPIPRPA